MSDSKNKDEVKISQEMLTLYKECQTLVSALSISFESATESNEITLMRMQAQCIMDKLKKVYS